MLLNSHPGSSEPRVSVRKTLRAAALILLALHLFGWQAGAGAVRLAAFSAPDAAGKRRDPVQEKIDRILQNGSKSPVPPLTTRFSEDEVNQVLRAEMKELRSGLSDPQVRLIGDNTLAVRITVDLDEYRRRRPGRGGLGPLALLTGRLPVTLRGVLHTRDGRGQLQLERADVNGMPVPPALAREMIRALSRNQRTPEGYDVEQAFILPAEIQTVTINPKEAVVRQ